MEDELKQKRFLWGVALTWAPWLPITIGLGHLFVGISSSKATGLAAVAGGFAEMYVLVGLAATVICEVCAMVLLFPAFSLGHSLCNPVSVLSIFIIGFVYIFFSPSFLAVL